MTQLEITLVWIIVAGHARIRTGRGSPSSGLAARTRQRLMDGRGEPGDDRRCHGHCPCASSAIMGPGPES